MAYSPGNAHSGSLRGLGAAECAGVGDWYGVVALSPPCSQREWVLQTPSPNIGEEFPRSEETSSPSFT